MTQTRRIQLLIAFALVFVALGSYTLLAWAPVPVESDPLVRMPGTQPGQVTTLESANRCLNCHSGYDPAIEPGTNWQGSMMAQAARDFLFWACLTVAGQDSIWALGRPNAVDICERCHFPKGWLEGRSDPPNASLMTGADFDGVQCDFCHNLYDPFFEGTRYLAREGDLNSDGSISADEWQTYWDETNSSSTPSQPAAAATYDEDSTLAQTITLFNGDPFFRADNQPDSPTYTENGAGQYFVSPNGDKRASFADANGRHPMLYSRYHKSKYFCNACHDVSNPALANLGDDPGQPLTTETDSAYSYFHVERTFSEFMLSDYGLEGGSTGIGPFAPDLFETSHANNQIATCQDCHMPDGIGQAADMKNAVNRPAGSVEHPNSGQPVHDLTGGNAWVSYVLASAVPGSPNYDATNDALLQQGPTTLTLDLSQGVGFDPVALLGGVERAKQQLLQAAAIQNLEYDPGSGVLSFQVQNQTGHKLISGFPEGRRMFVNIKAYAGGNLIYEVNPYDAAAGTLKGLNYPYQTGMGLPVPQPLTASEAYVDELVYEMKPSSTLTGEVKTFHFALADGRYKDNRIPPKGFRIDEAAQRLSVPVWHGENAPGYFSDEEYAGGYDAVSLDLQAGADHVEVTLYYQTTSREYIEFLRDEINGTGNLTLSGSGAAGDPAYLIQTDPFFSQLNAWGDTIWQLWDHNKNVPGASPFEMAQASLGVVPPPAVQFTTDVQTVSENIGSVTISVEMTGTTSDTVTIPFTVSGTATGEGVDHNLADGSFSIPPGSDTDEVTFQVTNDSRYEAPETVIVTLGQPDHATLGSRDTQTITITDDDSPPSLSFSSTTFSESEGGGLATITVTLSGDTAVTATVDYAASDGSAEAGADYTATSGTLTFTLGATTQTFTVPILDDDQPEDDETVILALTQPVSATIGTGSAVLTILDDDGALPTLAISDASAGESDGTMVFTVTLSAASGSEVSVSYVSANGNGLTGAQAGLDYEATSGTLLIPAGEVEGQIPVTLLSDATFELDETFSLTLSVPSQATIADGQATGTIFNDDPAPHIDFGSAAYQVPEADGLAQITVTLSGETALTATVTYASSDSTATAGDDYLSVSGTLTFAPGTGQKTFPVPLIDDTFDEADETVDLSLTGATSATLGLDTAVLTIADDDPAPTLSIADASANEDEGTMTFTVTLSATSGREVQVDYATANGSGANGALAGSDYTAKSGTLTIPAGADQDHITISLLDDALDEADETFVLNLTNAANASISDPQATGTILDDDPLPTLSIADASANEDEGTMIFTVTLSTGSGLDVSVDYATADGTGPGGAQAGLDYEATSGTLLIPAGATDGHIPVTLLSDDTFELDETFSLMLNTPGQATPGDGQATGTILNDDPAPGLSFSSAAYSAPEAAGTALITVTLSGETALTATVVYTSSDGTATAGDDYTPASGTLTFPPGTTRQTFPVQILDDGDDEADETVDLALSGVTSATLELDAAVLTIVDDEGEPTLSINDASANESEGTMTFVVQLSFASAFDVSVDYTTGDGPPGPGGAMAGSDYGDSSGRLTIPAGSTQHLISVTILPDSLYEGDEQFKVELSNPENAGLTDAVGQGTIVDDENPPQIGFSSAIYEVDENVAGSTATITVTLSGATALTATVNYGAGDGTAGEADYGAISGTLSFPPGVASQAFDVAILDDALDELAETVLLTLTNPSHADLALYGATLTIVDDDPPPEVTIGDAAMIEAEGVLAFAVSLSAPSGLDVGVAYTTQDGVGPGGATAGADYLAASGVLTLPAGSSSAAIQIHIHDDDLYEQDETFTVVLSGPVHAVLGDGLATGTIWNGDAAPQIGFSEALYQVEEAAGTVALTVTLSGSTALSATVNYATSDVPPPGGAEAGTDYEDTGGTLTFLPGETSHAITIIILDDALAEGNETFAVTLWGANQATIGGDATGIVRILDDDAHRVFLPLVIRGVP